MGTKNPFRYRGYYYDTESGLYYLNSRYYSPEFGRFISADVFISTGQGLQGANMFAYCGNNPIVLQDSGGSYPTYSMMMADNGGGNIKPAPQQEAKTLKPDKQSDWGKSALISVVKSVGDAIIGSQIAKALTSVWKSTPPLQVPLKTLTNSGPVAGIIGGATKVTGALSVGLFAYDIYSDIRDYSGWDLVGAIALDTVGIEVPIGIACVTSPFLTPIGGVVVAIIVGVPTEYGVQYAKNTWLKKRG